MNQTISQNKFSWRRVAMVARYHYPNLRLQIILYPIISVVLGLLISLGSINIISSFDSPAGFGMFQIVSSFAVGVSGLVLSFMLYFAPAPFCRPSREVEVTLPALWTEKATFALLYLFVFIPVILYLPRLVIQMIFDVVQNTETLRDSAFGAGYNFGSQWFSVDMLSSMVPLAVCAYVVFSRPKASFGRAAAMAIVALVGIGIIGTILILITTIPELMSMAESGVSPDRLDMEFTDSWVKEFSYSRYFIGALSALIAGVFIWLTARSFKKIQL